MITRILYGKHNGQYNYSEFVIDSADDIAKLPTSTADTVADGQHFNTCSVGSIAVVTGERKTYILNNNDEWTLFENFAAGSGGGGIAVPPNVSDNNRGIVTVTWG